jgi:hypothetical protein
MSSEESIGALRIEIEQMAAKFVATLEEKKQYTVILTADGAKHRITGYPNPLPARYLAKWEDDRTRNDVDLSL